MEKFDMKTANKIIKQMKGRRIYNAGCCTVGEMVSEKGHQEFWEVAHPQDCDWCEVLVFAVNSLPLAVERIKELEKERKISAHAAQE